MCIRDRVDEAAKSAEDALAAFEREALTADGVNDLRDKVESERAALEKLDGEITTAEERHEILSSDYADAAAGKSGPLEQARSLIAKTLSKRPIPDLKILAAETVDQADDRLVDDLIRLRRERLELNENRRAVKRSLDRHKQILSDLEEVRRKFKRARYDSPYSEFPGSDLVGGLVTEFVRGALGSDDLWRKLRRAQQTRKRNWDDDFGGNEWRGGFGLPDNYTTRGSRNRRTTRTNHRQVRIPRTPRAPRIRFPRSGGSRSRGGGGFKTGGGF